jgi:hypothetical protein
VSCFIMCGKGLNLCVSVCVCVREREIEREGGGREGMNDGHNPKYFQLGKENALYSYMINIITYSDLC